MKCNLESQATVQGCKAVLSRWTIIGLVLLAASLTEVAHAIDSEPYPAGYALSRLLPEHGGDGSTGFVLNGIDAGDWSGRSVAMAGDVNGDGIDDVIISATEVYAGGQAGAGEIYVVFGRDAAQMGFAPQFELSDLLPSNGGDGSDGFVVSGLNSYDRFGFSVAAAGDVNGDDIADLVIGAPFVDPSNVGRTYVIFGSAAGFPATINLASLDGTNGFVLRGVDPFDNSGRFVSGAGDINDDGIDDLLIGAPFADPNGNASGEAYVVFGDAIGFPPLLQLSTLNGTNGFVLHGVETGSGTPDRAGAKVSGAGDVNHDGIDDFMVAAMYADPNGVVDAGNVYVVYGSNAGFPAQFELASLNGTNGFVLNGIAAEDYCGYSVSAAGDVNADGIDDLVVAADYADPNGLDRAGQSYVVFGRDGGFPAAIELSSLDGTTGFALNGVDWGDAVSGVTLASAGDFNADGFDDVLIGAPAAYFGLGRIYLVYGSDQGFPATVDLASLDGTTGFVIKGVDIEDYPSWISGIRAGGDVNGDGIADLVIGAIGGDPGGRRDAGESYVVFGASTFPLLAIPDSLTFVAGSEVGSQSVTGLSGTRIPNLQSATVGLGKGKIRVVSVTGETGDHYTPYDQPDGVGIAFFDVPADTASLRVSPLVSEATELGLFVGYDANADGAISLDEERCYNGDFGTNNMCLVSAPEAGSWWVAVVNAVASAPTATDDTTLLFVPMSASAGNFTASSGVGPIDDLAPIPLELAWNLDDAEVGAVYGGTIVFSSDVGNVADLGTIDLTLMWDDDGDAVADVYDNCTSVANPGQVDADGDGIGNFCDADLNNDCIVNPVDLGLFKSVFFTADTQADLNSDGVVNPVDLGIFKSLFFLPPGPSGQDDICD